MAKALGVGGVFFKARDHKALAEWYRLWLGLPIEEEWGGCSFTPAMMPEKGATVWSPFKDSTDYFEPSTQPFMINLVVDDVHEALEQVSQGGAEVVGDVQALDYGDFGWFMDPEGNKVELWQPK